MSEYFTYIIRSQNKTNSTDNSNNCTILLGGLSSNCNKFECEVIDFYLLSGNIINSTTTELRAVDFGFMNGYDTKYKSLSTLAITNNARTSVGLKFNITNFNNKLVNFKLFNDNDELLKYSLINTTNELDYNDNWVLILKIKELK